MSLEQQRAVWCKDHLHKAINYIKKNKLASANRDIYEFGVYRGESLFLIENIYKIHNIPYGCTYGFDSFEGLPAEAPGVPKFYVFNQGAFADIDKLFEIKGHYIKGWFNELSQDHIDHFKFKPAQLVHIDCDLYISAYQALDFMLANDLITTGTVICYDEFKSTDKMWDGGEARAHKEICDKYQMNCEEFFRNVYFDTLDCWQNAFVVKGFDKVNYGVY